MTTWRCEFYLLVLKIFSYSFAYLWGILPTLKGKIRVSTVIYNNLYVSTRDPLRTLYVSSFHNLGNLNIVSTVVGGRMEKMALSIL